MARLRSLWRGLRHRGEVEAGMLEEFRHHLELRTEDLMRRGVPSREAARKARLEFGHIEGIREEGRAARGLRLFDRLGFSWLDLKLGVRMVRKYPALSLVSTCGIAVVVAIGAIGFGVIDTFTGSDLPLPAGDRLVTIQNVRGLDAFRSTHLNDGPAWREALNGLADLGAYRIVTRNLAAGEGPLTSARVVEMTASGFRIAGVAPLLGRTLVDADERPGEPPVVVIGHGVWQDRFGGREDVVGRTLRIGGTPHTVVGVMPREFAFPINNRVWTPLRLKPGDFERGFAPDIDVFARLAPGVTLKQVQAELTVVGARMAPLPVGMPQHLAPRVFPYSLELMWGGMRLALYAAQSFLTVLLAVISINVAALVYARTATRMGEIAVRTALGASRGRIARQLLAEGLVLACGGAMLGLLVARAGLARLGLMIQVEGGEQVPFWWDFDLSAATIVYVIAVAVLSAVIIGLVPIIGVTGRRLRRGFEQLGSGGAAPRLGWVWRTLIFSQVALAVTVLPVAVNALTQWARTGMAGRDPTADEIVAARLHLDEHAQRSSDLPERYAALQTAVVQRLEREPGVAHVIEMRPAPWDDPDYPVEIMAGPLPTSDAAAEVPTTMGVNAGWSRVEPEFFDAIDVGALVGRLFEPEDARGGEAVVVVSEGFVARVLGGGPAVGRWIRPAIQGDDRPAAERERWHRIIGIVPDVPKAVSPYPPEPKVYQPLIAGTREPVTLAVRIRAIPPVRFEQRLREIGTEIDPSLRIEGESLGARMRQGEAQARMLAITIGAFALSTLLIALAGLYALVSFTIVRRRREIGIRSALGGNPRRILGGVLAGVCRQIAIGIAAGLAVAALLDRAFGGELLSGREAVLLPAVGALVAAAGLISAWHPVRRGLTVPPTEALRAE